MQLNHLQKEFMLFLRDKPNLYEPLLASIETDSQFSASERLALYSNTSSNAYKKALSETYQTCKKILGEKYFNQIANVYVKEKPSLNPDLNQYGHDFPEWLTIFSQRQEELSDYPYLIDLAKLEWFKQSAFYAEDVVAFNFLALSKVDEPSQAKIIFKINPALSLLKSEYPIYEIWKLNNSKNEEQSEIKTDSSKQYLCVNRQDLNVKVQLLEPYEFELIKEIQRGVTLGELGKKHNEKNEKLNKLLPLLIKKSMVSDFYIAI